MYIEITYDTFDITKRLKAIDKDYFVRYNKSQKRYEVWLKSGLEAHLELVIPYGKLDVRTITKVLESKAERLNEILKQIEYENMLLQQKLDDELKDEIKYKVTTMLKY